MVEIASVILPTLAYLLLTFILALIFSTFIARVILHTLFEAVEHRDPVNPDNDTIHGNATSPPRSIQPEENLQQDA